MHYQVIIYVLVIDFLALMSPGPDFFMVLKNSLTGKFEYGFYTALGVAVGCGIVFSISLFGLGALIIKSQSIFKIIKLSGATYLVYLAIKSLSAKTQVQEPQLIGQNSHQTNFTQYFKMGLLCNLSNPKSFMFCVALASYIAGHGSLFLDGSVIVTGSVIATIIWFSLVSHLFGTIKARKIFYKNQRVIHIIFAIILLYVASKIIMF